MSQSTETSPKPTTEPLKLTAEAVNYLIKILPKGTAYCIGIVLVPRFRTSKCSIKKYIVLKSPKIIPGQEYFSFH
ncbi:hypothetical protein WH8501_06305 [Crocosphaera watsonii WH 8501]|uniref:hypothetical protein n=1 Tax=Crocosphaera watsonii TaxID=263511 RepID=UPI0002D2CD8F|nr:hypothetical protein [Crocosphaera watsonii]